MYTKFYSVTAKLTVLPFYKRKSWLQVPHTTTLSLRVCSVTYKLKVVHWDLSGKGVIILSFYNLGGAYQQLSHSLYTNTFRIIFLLNQSRHTTSLRRLREKTPSESPEPSRHWNLWLKPNLFLSYLRWKEVGEPSPSPSRNDTSWDTRDPGRTRQVTVNDSKPFKRSGRDCPASKGVNDQTQTQLQISYRLFVWFRGLSCTRVLSTSVGTVEVVHVWSWCTIRYFGVRYDRSVPDDWRMSNRPQLKRYVRECERRFLLA